MAWRHPSPSNPARLSDHCTEDEGHPAYGATRIDSIDAQGHDRADDPRSNAADRQRLAMKDIPASNRVDDDEDQSKLQTARSWRHNA